MIFDVVLCIAALVLGFIGIVNIYIMKDFKNDLNTKLDRVIAFYRDDRDQMKKDVDGLRDNVHDVCKTQVKHETLMSVWGKKENE